MKCNLDFKSTLKSTLISKRQFLPWNQGWFQGNLNLSQVHNVHNVSVVSSEEGVHIIISNDSLEQFSWMILLNNSFKRLLLRYRGVTGSCFLWEASLIFVQLSQIHSLGYKNMDKVSVKRSKLANEIFFLQHWSIPRSEERSLSSLTFYLWGL